jgi:hypothetical protein
MRCYTIAIRFGNKDNYSWMADFIDAEDAQRYKKEQEKLFPKRVIIIEM